MIPRCSTTHLPKTAKTSILWRHNHLNPLANDIERQWLARRGALTVGLRELGRLQLRVLRESIALPSPDERIAMHLCSREPAHVREICLSINEVDCVVARSIVSMQAWRSSWQAVGNLGRRPLADILYEDRRVSRSVFQSARLRLPHPLAHLALLLDPNSRGHRSHGYWARRSVFWRGGEPLLVAECFLPAFWQMATTHRCTNG